MKALKTAFLAAEGLLYAAFLTLDLLHQNAGVSAGLKYASILLVVLACAAALGTRDGRTVFAALVLTAAADVLLLLLDAQYALGVALFLGVQILYTARLCRLHGMNLTLHLTARAMLAGFAALWVRQSYGGLEALAVGYIVWFFMNLAHGIALAHRQPSGRTIRFAAGLALFFLCDLCVGVHNLPDNALSAFASVAMWAFYLPGQVLIALSTDSFGGLHDEV